MRKITREVIQVWNEKAKKRLHAFKTNWRWLTYQNSLEKGDEQVCQICVYKNFYVPVLTRIIVVVCDQIKWNEKEY